VSTVAAPRTVMRFAGRYAFLCNFYGCRNGVLWGDDVTPPRLWYHVEAPYQLAKTLDPVQRLRGIYKYELVGSPGTVKAFGRAIRPLRPDWEQVKLDIMRECVRSKFQRDVGLRRKLLATGDAKLVEGNYHHDVIWGVALADVPAKGIRKGDGTNWLGQVLMEVRDEFR
jgi:ribA/ribD-fused uncharacterized protein